jgi:hypothetical protein
VYFEVFQNPQNPGEIRFIEHWNASVEWFATVSLLYTWTWKCRREGADVNLKVLMKKQIQAQKDYYKPYQAVTEPMWIKPRELEIWSRKGEEWRNVKM